MHGPDGTDYPNKTIYLEVEKYSRLVYDHGGNDDHGPLFRVTVVFTENKSKASHPINSVSTTMDMTMTLPSAEAAAQTHKFIKQANGYSTWDRLAEYLTHESTGKEEFVLNHSFDAPIETLFEMWTNPEHLCRWITPKGFNAEFIRCDIRPGGSTFSLMSDGDQIRMYGRADYLEVSKPNKIVYVQQFCDQNEKAVRHPMSSTWPESMMTKVELNEEGPNRTRVTITWEPYGNVSSEELQSFIKARSGMSQGWNGSFDQLENYLKKLS